MQDNKVPRPGAPGKSAEYDMIVVGGGITGSGIARDVHPVFEAGAKLRRSFEVDAD